MEKDNKKNNVETKKKESVVKNNNVETKKDNTKFSKVEPKNLKKEDKKEAKANKEQKALKKSNMLGIWISGIVLILVLLLVVAALIILPQSPKKSVEGMLNCLKNGDFTGVSKYLNYEEVLNQVNLSEDNQMSQEMQVLFFNKLSWKILNVNEEKDIAKVEVEIVNKDFKTIISNYMQKALQSAFSGGNLSDEEQTNYLMDELKSESIPTVTTTSTLEVVKKDGEWKITSNEDLLNALLPGYEDAINSINSIVSAE